jgi:isopropylmalate/homocitrate/citramalate synthase
MADASDVMKKITRSPNVSYPVLVPNMRGFKLATAVGVQEIAIFAAASEKFSRRNINCSIEESFKRYEDVSAAAKASGIKMRGYTPTTQPTIVNVFFFFGCVFFFFAKSAAVKMIVGRVKPN